MATHSNISFASLSECPYCKHGSLIRKLEGKDFETGFGTFTIFACTACHLNFTSPKPDNKDIPLLYETRETRDFQNAKGIINHFRNWVLKKRYHQWINTLTSARLDILDYACGNGALLVALSNVDKIQSLTGTDFQQEPPSNLLNLSPKISYQSLTDFEKSNSLYDIIFCRHVLEHHPKPWELLDQLICRIKKGGLIIFEVPNFESIWNKILGKYSFPIYLPRHIYHFTTQFFSRNICAKKQLCLSHTPMLGGSLGYLLKKNIPNMGVIGILLYPLQFIVDWIFRRSTVIMGVIQTPK